MLHHNNILQNKVVKSSGNSWLLIIEIRSIYVRVVPWAVWGVTYEVLGVTRLFRHKLEENCPSLSVSHTVCVIMMISVFTIYVFVEFKFKWSVVWWCGSRRPWGNYWEKNKVKDNNWRSTWYTSNWQSGRVSYVILTVSSWLVWIKKEPCCTPVVV